MNNTTLNFKQAEKVENEQIYEKAMSDVKAVYEGNNSSATFMRLASKKDCEAYIYVNNWISGQSSKRYERTK